MKASPTSSSSNKRTYQAPQVVRVILRPEEAVLGHCKVPGIAGAVSSGCGKPIRCNTFGS